MDRRDFISSSAVSAGPLGLTMDVALQKEVMGYPYWFHRQPDCRQFYKASSP